jgi:hypothetical protein
MNFFVELYRFMAMFPDCPTIIGGDWNATFSLDNTDNNIDIFRMLSPPSITRSRAIAEMCETHKLTDPFRTLHPDTREFTFRPHTRRGNRSRLDFFLISDQLLRYLSDCNISNALSTELFDHKSVRLSLNKPKFRPNMSINLTTLNHPRLNDVISCAVTECYLHHADPVRAGPDVDIDTGLLATGEYRSKIRALNKLDLDIAACSNPQATAALILEREGKNRDLEEVRLTQPSPEELATIPLSCEDDVFMEVLLGNLKGAILSLQAWQRKVSNIKKGNIIAEINNLRNDFLIHSDRITELEEELNRIAEGEIRERIKAMKIFEGLHSEKPNSLFLSLAKNSNKGDSLGKIKKPGGGDFDTVEERGEYIADFFEKLYKKPENLPDTYENIIEDFLGPDIVNSDVVMQSKLTPEERDEMECPIQVTELDKAVEEGNSRSAPGTDGFGMPLIKRCWQHIRLPLLKYTHCCYNKGTLTDNFRGASIKLIPKKTNPIEIKNWRPISLLSNLYKVISRALNNRLNKIVNRVCSRAQKGFNNQRFTQEVLINVWESVAACKKNKVRGAILAIDMAKAFDTLSNDFLLAVYKFFGFGPTMIRWLQLIGNNRYACINLGGGTLSRRFLLERGRPQGDVISPNTFNFCAQILIFKLELDKRIKNMSPTGGTHINNNANSFFMCESNRETNKNESLADDNTTLTLMDLASLRAAKESLDNFGNISGLKCNFEKSVIMPILVPTVAEVEMIERLGFTIVDELTLLGVKINRDLNNIPEIYQGIKQKIVNLISFWERFRLTLPGRLTILKTCLISQINYIGCFLPPDPDTLNEIQAICDGFVKKNLKIGTERLYMAPEYGGLGCINLKTFLAAQNCSWIRRAYEACIDNWRYDLKKCAPEGRIEDLVPSDLDPVIHPVLYNMVESLQLLNKDLGQINNNFQKMKVFDNLCFTQGPGNHGVLDKEFFGLRFYNLHGQALRNKNFEDFFVGTRVKNLAEMTEMGLPLSMAIWFKFQASLIFNRQRLKVEPEPGKAPANVKYLFDLKSKGSKKFTNIFNKVRADQHAVEDLRIVNTFARLTGTRIPDPDILHISLGMWRCPALSNDCREFLFKFRNNQLMTNHRLNAFDNTISKNCTFCRIRNQQNDETFSHLFYNCPTTLYLLSGLVDLFEPAPDMREEKFKELYWFGISEEHIYYTKPILVCFEVFRYTLWKYKLRRKIPNRAKFIEEVRFQINVISDLNKYFRFGISGCNLIANLLQARG